MHRSYFILALIALGACTASAPPAPVAVPAVAVPAETVAPASRPRPLPNDVHWSRDSAEIRALYLQTYALAGRRLEELGSGRDPGTWAVALDADETVISNLRYQIESLEAGRPFSLETWTAWVRRREATALPGARAFLERARDLGGKIAIVTNRRDDVCADTEANFRDLGLPFDVMMCRTGESRKEPRWESVESGTARPGLPPLEILMWLGDNIEDFPGWSQERRSEPAAAFEDFGERFFVVPNPMYGSWVGNPPAEDP
jgi:5'-nucleotidase (lipoprotein e(P4) family)